MSSFFFTRDKVGTTVILVPMSPSDEIDRAFEAEFVEIRTSTATLKSSLDQSQKVYKISDCVYPALYSNSGFSYRVFSSWVEFDTHRVAGKVRPRLRDAVTGHNKLSDAQYKKIAEVLGWNDLLHV